MHIRAALFAACIAPCLLIACASEPVERADMSGSPEPRLGDGPLDGGAHPPGAPGDRMRPLFISPAGEPFHGADAGPPPVALWFAQADADHDGKLTRRELTGDFERFFKRLDTNGDGVIDGFEAQAYERTVAPELLPRIGRLRAGEGQDQQLFKRGGGGGASAGRGGRRGDIGGGKVSAAGGAQAAGVYQLLPDAEPIISADVDLDGKVTLTEWRGRAAVVFAELDAKLVGFLTLEGLPNTPQQAAIEKRKAADDKRRPR